MCVRTTQDENMVAYLTRLASRSIVQWCHEPGREPDPDTLWHNTLWNSAKTEKHAEETRFSQVSCQPPRTKEVLHGGSLHPLCWT